MGALGNGVRLLVRAVQHLAILLAVAVAANGQYYLSDNFATWNSGAWAKNGSPQFTGSGLQGNAPYSSSVVAYNNGGDGTRHEVKATFANFLASGSLNSVDIYLAANTSLTTGYRLAFRNPYTNAVTLDVYDVSNSWFSLGGATFAYNPSVPTVVRAIKATNGIRVVIGNQSAWFPITGASGSQGVGFTGGGNGPITLAELAAADTTAPGTVGTIGAWAMANEIDLQWTAATDNGGGSGVFRYNIYRNGTLIGSTRGLSYSDPSVAAGTTYTYTVKAEDFFTNEGTGANKVVTASANNLRQTGLRPLGSYWGGGGENIDMRSGNLNYTVGLLRAQSRHGLSMGFALNYNSQTWRYGDSMNWNLGTDVGYGYGFKLLAGSIYPVYNSGSIAQYIFTDSSGAEYRLDVPSSGHWWSREGLYLHFDPGTNRVYFQDGSYWVMGATSWSPEQDAGTLYPTMAVDTNGNQIQIQYKPALGSATVNTSARLDWIWDARAGGYPNVSYSFTYDANHDVTNCGYTTAEAIPRLTSITTSLPTGENYSFTYQCQSTLTSPFTATTVPGKYVALASRTVVSAAPGASLTYNFGWNSSLELTQVTYPYGGTLRWAPASITAPSGQQVRGVNTRYLKGSVGGTEYTYTLARDVAAGWTYLDDADGKSRKRWEFETSTAAASYGLVKKQMQIARPALTTMRQTDVTWTTTGFGSLYIVSQTTQIDPGQAYAKTMKSEQALNLMGNVTQTKLYDFGSLVTPKWQMDYTYLSGANYDSRWITNRVTEVWLKFNGGTAKKYYQASYDGGSLTNRPTSVPLWDFTNYGVGMVYRGNVTSSGVPSFPQTAVSYDATGMPVSTTRIGVTTNVNTYDTNNVAPTYITTGSLGVTMNYNQIYQNTQTVGPNSATVSATYDSVARPATETAATGVVTTYTYSSSAPQITAQVDVAHGGPWTKTYLDGLGRAVKVERGTGGTVVSTVETEYAPCGCSPMAKVKRASMPYAPGGTKYWTTYNYDAAGRTTSVVAPDGASTTYTVYEGNTTKVTSPAGKWKKQEVDAAGNVKRVTEPNPAGGEWYTDYSYNDRNLLLTTTMTRGAATQTRTFTYNDAGQVLTATNPENGTVTNTYNVDAQLSQKVDALGNKVTYVYGDSLKRLTEIHRFVGAVEQSDQLVKLYYDSNAAYGTNLSGRLAYTEFWTKRKKDTWVGAGSTPLLHFKEMYSYKPAGQVIGKRLWAESGTGTDTLDTSYDYDDWGRMKQQTYPSAQPSGGGADVAGDVFDYTFDALGRPYGMTANNNATNWISGVTYNAADLPTAITAGNGSVAGESREYNVMGQLTRIVSGNYDFRYSFSATQNDGRITAQSGYQSGVLQETVNYTYDALNRLTGASTSAGTAWSATYSYDGFTNLLDITSSGSIPPSPLSITVDTTNNRVSTGTLVL